MVKWSRVRNSNPYTWSSIYRCLLEHVFIFPDDEKESNPTSFKFLQMAHAWKEAQKKKEMEVASAPIITSTREDEAMDDDEDDNDRSSSDES